MLTEQLSDDLDYEHFITKIKRMTTIDLAQYKKTQMKRRLTTLRMKRGYSTFADYARALSKDQTLLLEFLDRMTINVSEFWRNPARWEWLSTKFIPELSASRHSLKCWSAACSTGEEPYTLAMILHDHGLLRNSIIVASDIDEGALAKAKAGQFPERSMREMSAQHLNTYFQQEGQTYQVSPILQKAIQFEQKNLLTDPFDDAFDLIICRNVIIYFTEEAKLELYQKFANALRPGGILFVGSTEQIFSPHRYGLESADTFFYRKKSGNEATV